MATTKFYHDLRKVNKDQEGVMKIALSHRDKTSYISTGVKLRKDQWVINKNNEFEVVNRPDSELLTIIIREKKAKIQSLIFDYMRDGILETITVSQLKTKIEETLNPKVEESIEDKSLFKTIFEQFIINKKASTKEVYEHTRNRIEAFLAFDPKEPKFKALHFEDITIEWLHRFNAFMAPTAPSVNTRNIHFRNLRAVFNYAIECEVTSHYPFRKFKIKAVETAKRSLSVEELRQLIYFPCEPHQEKYIDMFKLSFYLMGVNMIDLCKLTEIRNGRLEFNRSKTGHLYSMKVEPEAAALFEKHKGTDHLLFILDRWTNDEFFRRKMNKELQKMGPMKKKPGRGGKKEYSPLFPEITSYWARHSWATIADELDIPDKVISEALGHEHGNKVTNIYIRKSVKKVDIANRKVLDWVLYGKLEGKEVVRPGSPEFFGLDLKRTKELGLYLKKG